MAQGERARPDGTAIAGALMRSRLRLMEANAAIERASQVGRANGSGGTLPVIRNRSVGVGDEILVDGKMGLTADVSRARWSDADRLARELIATREESAQLRDAIRAFVEGAAGRDVEAKARSRGAGGLLVAQRESRSAEVYHVRANPGSIFYVAGR